jgi:hypothetical protein
MSSSFAGPSIRLGSGSASGGSSHGSSSVAAHMQEALARLLLLRPAKPVEFLAE